MWLKILQVLSSPFSSLLCVWIFYVILGIFTVFHTIVSIISALAHHSGAIGSQSVSLYGKHAWVKPGPLNYLSWAGRMGSCWEQSHITPRTAWTVPALYSSRQTWIPVSSWNNTAIKRPRCYQQHGDSALHLQTLTSKNDLYMRTLGESHTNKYILRTLVVTQCPLLKEAVQCSA